MASGVTNFVEQMNSRRGLREPEMALDTVPIAHTAPPSIPYKCDIAGSPKYSPRESTPSLQRGEQQTSSISSGELTVTERVKSMNELYLG